MIGDEKFIVIFGCGGHGRSVTDILLSTITDVSILFIDDEASSGERIFGFEVHKNYTPSKEQVFLAIGDNVARKSKYYALGGNALNLYTIISATAHRGRGSSIGRGCFIGNFCHIGPEAVIGMGTILNNGSIIEHEVKIGDFSHIGPNATISGRCNVGNLVFVGVGATVKDNLSICSNVTIGAGATVVTDITEPGTYVGTPAYKIK